MLGVRSLQSGRKYDKKNKKDQILFLSSFIFVWLRSDGGGINSVSDYSSEYCVKRKRMTD